MNRRLFLRLAASLGFFATAARGQAPALDVNGILNDPEAPAGGNPKGDVTIVAFLDYNCPFCKKATPDLDKLVKTDGHIRLVYKDWPILTEASIYGAQMALAAKYQGKYEEVHAVLMHLTGGKSTQEKMLKAIASTSANMERLQDDLLAHDTEIQALLKRNNDQARSMGLQGTPVFLIGPFKVAAALDYAGFKQVVADARARAKAE